MNAPRQPPDRAIDSERRRAQGLLVRRIVAIAATLFGIVALLGWIPGIEEATEHRLGLVFICLGPLDLVILTVLSRLAGQRREEP